MSSIREDLLPQPGDVIADHYEIESLLGHGGMGAVFAAKHTRTGRAVAIKWMLPQAAASAEAVARFIAEAKATARIEHPNVVHIYDFGEAEGSPYLVMERLRGRSLREHLDDIGRLSPAEAIHLLVPAMRGVSEAHREGIIHRDIKPDNIFLCEGKDGSPREAKVVDFGISKLFDGDSNANLTGTGMMMGTPAYMSPEQLNAPRDADPRFDVYAFGVVFYEAVTGRLPYEADGIFQLVGQIMNADVVPPSQLHPELSLALDAIILRAMHRDQPERFASMQEMIDHFDALQQGPGAWPAAAMATPAPQGYMPQTAAMSSMAPPTHAGYGSHAGIGPAGTPYAPYPHPTAPKTSGLKIALIGGLALLLGGATAAGVAFLLVALDQDPPASEDVADTLDPPDVPLAVDEPSRVAAGAVPMAPSVAESEAEAEAVAEAEAESEAEVANTRRRRRRPRPSRPVVRPMAPTHPAPVVSRPPANSTARGANGAMIIE